MAAHNPQNALCPDSDSYDQLFLRREKRRRWLHGMPFLDDELMDLNKRPLFDGAHFRVPRLRKCPLDLDTVNWQRARLLGAGMDGCVWRVHFGNQGPYVLKVFWDADPPDEPGYYYAAQRECQNAALLQMLRASLDQYAEAVATVASGGTPDGPVEPPLLVPDPVSFDDAAGNLFSFTDESRRMHGTVANPDIPDAVPVCDMPRFAQCYGWLRVSSEILFRRMPKQIRQPSVCLSDEVRHLQHDKSEYLAIVYEYIGGDKSDVNKSNGDEKEENASQDANHPGCPRRSARLRHLAEMQTPQTKALAMSSTVENDTATALAKPKDKYGNDPEKVAAVAKFLYLAGFSFCPRPLARNWKNSVLVDHSDIVCPRSFGWKAKRYKLETVERLLTPDEFPVDDD